VEYNSSRNKLILPEYGRNVQKLVEQAVLIEDREERGKFVQKIIELMGRMYPYLRDLRDFKHKLWDHLVIMSNFRLDIESPYPMPQAEAYFEAPSKIPYSNKNFKYKHYGKTIGKVIAYAIELPEGEKKNTLIGLTANHMRKLYLTWSKDIVDDKEIFEHIRELSRGKLDIPEGMTLSTAKVHQQRPAPPTNYAKKRPVKRKY
jgi:hypothetical protein